MHLRLGQRKRQRRQTVRYRRWFVRVLLKLSFLVVRKLRQHRLSLLPLACLPPSLRRFLALPSLLRPMMQRSVRALFRRWFRPLPCPLMLSLLRRPMAL